MTKIKHGLDLPITGEPSQNSIDAKNVKHVAILGRDYVGMKPTMEVHVGDKVKLGQLLFTDKKMEGVKYTAPGAGKVIEINRGEKRIFLSLVIELEGNEEVTFKSYTEGELKTIDKDTVKSQLIDSGMWTSIKSRPFGKVAEPKSEPHSIFVTAMDTNPLAPSVEKILEGNENNFKNGLTLLSKLTEGKLYLCKKPNEKIPLPEISNLSVEEFDGPHPAGAPGTHIHFLDPVSRNKTVWNINAQDVAAIGSLFTTGKINVERIAAICGPSAKNPRLIKTRVGASIKELTEGEVKEGEVRIVSGSVLSGRHAVDAEEYLGRFHQQISLLEEGTKREFLGWLSPGSNLYSVKNIVISKLFRNKKFNFTTSTNGGPRAIVPIGSYETVMPLDIIPTYLLRALAVDDVEDAEALGVLELDEEDLALCTYVCPSKIDHGINLRRNLTLIEKEG
ncbi:MAG: Na(+)-translocating NADH-quinone reductase subunit A [Ignavibacteriae bacterium]|nr:Na(+)-translocating NADH-quinone reductase subunit A [Ignavibacteriota bacterium]NOG97686.1 Na(+)-translocating NADH-quinone reductase subunit A [Ignavibacteriota bacterium]